MAKDEKTVDIVEERVVIEPLIHIIRGQKVILDSDLARIYGVPTKVFNQAVKRNQDRFPRDFMFELEIAEWESLMRSQFVTASKRNVRFCPFVFTEHGAAMAANILNSPSTVQMSVFVVRAFMKMRAILSERSELVGELKTLEVKLTERLDIHEVAIVDILRRMMDLLDPPPAPSVPAKSKIGFH